MANLILHIIPRLPPGSTTINLMRVHDESDVPATISDDGERLTIEVASGREILTDGDSAARLPQSGSISYGQTLVFLSSESGQAVPAAIAFTYRTESSAARADLVNASWDGETATIAAPAGYSVEPVDRSACAAEQAQPNVVDCAATGTPPHLLAFTTSMTGQRRALATPFAPLIRPQISAPLGPARAGTPVTLTGSVSSPGGSLTTPVVQSCIWDLGDGSLASGPTVSHVYPSPGIDTAELILVGAGGPITAVGCRPALLFHP